MIYGVGLFEYYQEKRMHYAKESLQKGGVKIKDVVAALGYENASKFTAAFKKQFDTLPSEVPENNLK